MTTRNQRPPTRRAPQGRPDAGASVDGNARTCVGCGEHCAPDDLVRLVLAGDDEVVCDAKGGSFGRGAHVHPTSSCVRDACKKGLARAFRREMRIDPAAVASSIASAYRRRLDGLLSGGARAGHVVLGSDSVEESIAEGEVTLVVVAADAAAAAHRRGVESMTGAGNAIVHGDKSSLGRAVGSKGEVGVCAVTNVALATAIRRAWLCAVGVSSTVAEA